MLYELGQKPQKSSVFQYTKVLAMKVPHTCEEIKGQNGSKLQG